MICTLLGCYAGSNGNPLLTFRDSISVPSSRVKKSKKQTLEDGINTLSQNISKGLSLDAAEHPRRVQISTWCGNLKSWKINV
jgi:hypothetical protein